MEKTILVKLKDIYFHELGFLCTVIRDECATVFAATPSFIADDERLWTIDPRLHSHIWHALTAAANVKRLLDDQRPRNTRNESAAAHELRQARAQMLKADLDGIDLTEMLDSAVRNSLEHFDEYLDDVNVKLRDQSTPSIAMYNISMTQLDNLVFEEGPTLHFRIYESASRRFFHLKGSIDLGKVHDEAVAVLNRLKARGRIPPDGTTGVMSFLDFPQGSAPGS